MGGRGDGEAEEGVEGGKARESRRGGEERCVERNRKKQTKITTENERSNSNNSSLQDEGRGPSKNVVTVKKAGVGKELTGRPTARGKLRGDGTRCSVGQSERSE